MDRIKKAAAKGTPEGGDFLLPRFEMAEGDDAKLVFTQSPEVDHQLTIIGQKKPNDDASEHSPLQLTSKIPKEDKKNSYETTSFSLTQDNGKLFEYSNIWSIGTEWFGAALSYRLMADKLANAMAVTEIEGTIFRQSGTILGAKLQSDRQYRDAASIADDSIRVLAEGVILEQTVTIAEEDVFLGKQITLEDKQVQQIYGDYNWNYAFGAVPIVVNTRLVGSMGTGGPYVEFGIAPNTTDETQFSLFVRPWARLDITATGAIQTGIPKILSILSVGAGADLTFLKGSYLAQVYGVSYADEPCFKSEFIDFRALAGRVFAFAYFRLASELVDGFVDYVCNNGYITIPGCQTVQSALKTLGDEFNFNQVYELYSYPGFDLGERYKWFDGLACTAEPKK